MFFAVRFVLVGTGDCYICNIDWSLRMHICHYYCGGSVVALFWDECFCSVVVCLLRGCFGF